MKVTKREIQNDKEVGLLFVVFFTKSNGKKMYMVTRIEDKHVVYTAQFMTEYLRTLKLYGGDDETKA